MKKYDLFEEYQQGRIDTISWEEFLEKDESEGADNQVYIRNLQGELLGACSHEEFLAYINGETKELQPK